MSARNRMGLIAGAVLGALVVLPLAASAAAPRAERAAGAAAGAVDPDAVAALARMSNAISALKEFALTSDASTDYVLENGQKIQVNSTVSYKVRKPDRLFVQLQSARGERDIYFDGTTLTLYAPDRKFYASAETQGKTIAQLVLNAADRYHVQFPLTDLFFWGTQYAPQPKDVLTDAIDVGADTINGVATEHYAFRQQGTDWQIWLAKGTSLPQKLVIVTTTDPSMPQYEALLHWQTDASFNPSVFAFKAPAGAQRIRIARSAAAAAGQAGEEK